MSKKNKEPKEPKQTVKAIDDLHDLVEQLKYFYHGNSERFRKDALEKAVNIEKELHKLSVDKKVFSSKLRSIFGKQADDLKEEVQELKEELKVRGEKIEELVEEVKELKDET
jgi:FtsZ-binding cell division protein ZapB